MIEKEGAVKVRKWPGEQGGASSTSFLGGVRGNPASPGGHAGRTSSRKGQLWWREGTWALRGGSSACEGVCR